MKGSEKKSNGGSDAVRSWPGNSANFKALRSGPYQGTKCIDVATHVIAGRGHPVERADRPIGTPIRPFVVAWQLSTHPIVASYWDCNEDDWFEDDDPSPLISIPFR